MPRGSSGWLRGSDRRERGARARQEQLVELHIYQPSTWRLPSRKLVLEEFHPQDPIVRMCNETDVVIGQDSHFDGDR